MVLFNLKGDVKEKAAYAKRKISHWNGKHLHCEPNCKLSYPPLDSPLIYRIFNESIQLHDKPIPSTLTAKSPLIH